MKKPYCDRKYPFSIYFLLAVKFENKKLCFLMGKQKTTLFTKIPNNLVIITMLKMSQEIIYLDL